MKRKLFFIGLPVNYLLVLSVISFVGDHFSGNGLLLFVFGAIIIALFIAPRYKSYTFFSLSHLHLPPFFFRLGAALPIKDIDRIEHAIEENERVFIACNPDWLLRGAIQHHVETQFGQVEFVDSGSWDIATEPFDTASLEVTFNDAGKLSDAVSRLMARGWQKVGTLYEEHKGSRATYSQNMQFVRVSK